MDLDTKTVIWRGGGLVIRSLFIHSYFPYLVFDAFSNGNRDAFFFVALSKNAVVNLCVFSRFPEINDFFSRV